jgi:hypothetical protein
MPDLGMLLEDTPHLHALINLEPTTKRFPNPISTNPNQLVGSVVAGTKMDVKPDLQ